MSGKPKTGPTASSATRSYAQEVLSLHTDMGSAMVRAMSQALDDVTKGDPLPAAAVANTLHYRGACDLLRPLLMPDDGPGLTDESFRQYCRRARLAIQYGLQWDDTRPGRFVSREFVRIGEIARTITPEEPRNPRTVETAIDRVLRERLHSAAEQSRQTRRQIEREARKVGRPVTLPPIGKGTASEEWFAIIAKAYSDVDLPKPDRNSTPEYRTCYAFIQKCIARAALKASN